MTGAPNGVPIEEPRVLVQGRQSHQLSFDFFPLGERVDQQALVTVDRDHEPGIPAFLQALAIPGRNDHPALRVEGDLRCTAKHEIKRDVVPFPPTFSHSLPL